MQWALSEISGYSVHARDGSLGIVQDLYFDDVDWRVRYLAVSGGVRAGPGKFLLAPEVISSTDREFGLISVFLRTAAVHESPAVTTAGNIPRQEEARLREYYGWPDYWPAPSSSEQGAYTQAAGSPRLLSVEEVLGYRVLAGREDIGPLLDLIIDDHTWKIHCLVVDASHWLPTGRVWVQTDCINQVRGAKQEIALTIPRDKVMHGPQPDLQGLCAPGTELSPPGDTHFASQRREGIPAT